MNAAVTMTRGPSLPDQVADRLRHDIMRGRYAVGEKMPTEQRIAEAYGVSRPIVREAVGRLKQDGLVTSRQGAGLFVASREVAGVLRLAGVDPSSRNDQRNIIELLIAVEASAAEHAARRRTDEQIKAIEKALNAVGDAIHRGDDGVREDIAFHRTIADASGNPLYGNLGEFLDGHVRRFIEFARANSARINGVVNIVQAEHEAIFAAISDQDDHQARLSATSHLTKAAARLGILIY